jgi:hypothetical protein
VRQIRMLRARRRELETGLRRLPHGHEGGNSGYGQGAAYGLPRQFPTLPEYTDSLSSYSCINLLESNHGPEWLRARTTCEG